MRLNVYRIENDGLLRIIDNVVYSFQETIPNIDISFRSSDGNIGAFFEV